MDLMTFMFNYQQYSLQNQKKIILNFICNQKRARIDKAILSKKNKARSITILGSKLYCEIIIKSPWCRKKKIDM